MSIFQDCEMKFGSWTYNGFKVNFMLQQDSGDISGFIANGEWALLGELKNIEKRICFHQDYCFRRSSQAQ